MGPHDGAIDKVNAPIDLARRLGVLLHGGEETVP